MKLVTTQGQPLLQTDLTTGQPFSNLFGRPILISQYSDAMTANKLPILFGDLKAGYTFRQAGRLAIRRLDERYAELNETAYIGFARCGAYNTDAGTHPIVSLKMSAS
jgi:HK97 family phage major capsid protein